MKSSDNWITVTESGFSWERDALNFVRERFPATEQYLAWSNFEFIASDGSINEVDLLVFTPQGFFLIEIKSRPGRISGDAGTWKWESGATFAVDNPLLLANQKARKLSNLLQQTKSFRKGGRVPFLEALVFCSAEQIQSDLTGTAAYRICFRDNVERSGKRAGIIDAILKRKCPGMDSTPKGTFDRPTARQIGKAIAEAGIRTSQRSRRVSDYALEQLIDEGPFYQDWRAKHSKLDSMVRRIRIYSISSGATSEQRKTLERAARREAEILDELRHPGVLRFEGLTQHELGPALIFEHDASLIRLDHYLKINQDRLTVDDRLHLVRQIAEVLSFAHEKRIFHRSLSPRSILVQPTPGGRARIRVFNWQLGAATETAEPDESGVSPNEASTITYGWSLAEIQAWKPSARRPAKRAAKKAAKKSAAPQKGGEETRKEGTRGIVSGIVASSNQYCRRGQRSKNMPGIRYFYGRNCRISQNR